MLPLFCFLQVPHSNSPAKLSISSHCKTASGVMMVNDYQWCLAPVLR